ncbi:MAG: acyl-CoA dehydrogenase family protein, partial [SAR324 cluster bacterium]|nr:acyl-CoA dehydrogenase family protein [SAR324 cluster bacterium]
GQGIVQAPELTEEEKRPLIAALEEKGWLAPHWPKEHGGAGFDLAQAIIFHEECGKAGVPIHRNNGINMLGPILIRYGTQKQQAQFLGPIKRNEMVWAQGYSEPQAGSDLAGLQIRADVTEDGFVINGQKIWTSRAHIADWIFMLVRTDPSAQRKQEGISFLLAELKSPGIEARPIITMEGFHHFNEVFFENVKVPAENLVGELNQGWKVAKALLGHERFNYFSSDPLVLGKAIDNLKSTARQAPRGDGAMWDSISIRRQVATMEMDVDCLRYTRYRALTKMQRGEAPGAETMLFKLFGSELNQRIVALQQDVEGPLGTVWDESYRGDGPGHVARHATNIRAATIRGGTSEVQRNIISKRVLGLPE